MPRGYPAVPRWFLPRLPAPPLAEADPRRGSAQAGGATGGHGGARSGGTRGCWGVRAVCGGCVSSYACCECLVWPGRDGPGGSLMRVYGGCVGAAMVTVMRAGAGVRGVLPAQVARALLAAVAE